VTERSARPSGERGPLFKALACDYDGTLATADRIAPVAVQALQCAREAGLRLILVTGRTFFELLRVCERLDLFDAVVAENGGVLYSPATGTIRDQGPPPAPRLLAELDRRGIAFQAGRVVIATMRSQEAEVRRAMTAAGIGLDLIYNRAALMLLPRGVSKGTGVRQVIREFGFSFHDVMALGDAENDLDLFDACGWTACPMNAVPALMERADWLFPGADGEGVARAIVERIVSGTLPAASSPRHQLTIGWAAGTAELVTIPARGVNVLIHGEPLSGKSWLAGGLIEHLHERRYAVCVLDPEGDYRMLGWLPKVTWAEVRDVAAAAALLREFERDPAACVVADLSTLSHAGRLQVVEAVLSAIRQLRQRVGLPHWVILDEAHYSLHREGVGDSAAGLSDKGFCMATYRASWLRETVRDTVDIEIVSRTSAPEELADLSARVAVSAATGDVASAATRLPRGTFLLIRHGEGGACTALTFVATPREIPHVRHRRKYASSTVPPDRSFVFRDREGAAVATADSLAAFQRVLAQVAEQVLLGHAERGDFSRWIRDVFRDRVLASQLRKTEARWRCREIPDLRVALRALIAAHYGIEAEPEPGDPAGP